MKGEEPSYLTKFASTDEYPIPWTTRGRNTENAVAGTLAQMLNISTNQSFQSRAVSTASRQVIPGGGFPADSPG